MIELEAPANVSQPQVAQFDHGTPTRPRDLSSTTGPQLDMVEIGPIKTTNLA